MLNMANRRVDKKGRTLSKGVTFDANRNRYRYTYTDVLGHRKSIYAISYEDLRERMKDLQRNQMDGLDVYLSGKADVNFVFDRYLASKTGLRGTTKTNYIYMYDKFVRNGFGKKKIAKIKYSDVLFFYKELLKEMQINTIEVINNVLRPTFELAVRDEIIRNNPVNGTLNELKKSGEYTVGKRKALTREQQDAFFQIINEPNHIRWSNLFTVMFGTGLRVGEFTALRWDDCDFENRVINITHSLSYYPQFDKDFKCAYRMGEPKTKAGIRTIPMLDKVYEALLNERAYQESNNKHCTNEIDGFSGFIFFNKFGNVHNQSSLNSAIQRLITKYNMDEELKAKKEKRKSIIIPHFTCHVVRHTFCTRLYENDVDIKTTQSIMGHTDVQTTLDIYADISEEKKKAVFIALNNNGVV